MSQKINNPSFRTSVRGYNKDDINKYIKELNGNFVFATRDYEDKIRALKSDVSEKEQIIAKLQKELSDCRNELAEAVSAKQIGRAHVWNSSHKVQSRMPSSA